MKIAIMICGHVRTFMKTSSSLIENIVEPFSEIGDVDFFIHTWDNMGWSQERENRDLPFFGLETDTMKPYILEELKNIKRMQIENFFDFDMSKYKSNWNVNAAGFKGSTYSWKKAFELIDEYEKTNNFVYDLIIKTRFDLVYPSKIDVSNLLYFIDKDNQLYIPSRNQPELDAYPNSNNCGDLFAIGNSVAMNVYTKMFDMIDYYFNNDKIIFCSEEMLRYHLDSSKISIISSLYSINIQRYNRIDY